MTFGNAIRAGNEVDVSRLLCQHGLELMNAKLSLHIVLNIDATLTPPASRRESLVQVTSSILKQNCNSSQNGSITVTPFQLGLLAQHRHIIKILMERIMEIKDTDSQLKWMENILGSKTSLVIPNNAAQCDKDTLSLNGINAFHLATRYDPMALKEIVCILNEKHMIPRLKDLLNEQDSNRKWTPLHIGAKCVSIEAVRY